VKVFLCIVTRMLLLYLEQLLRSYYRKQRKLKHQGTCCGLTVLLNLIDVHTKLMKLGEQCTWLPFIVRHCDSFPAESKAKDLRCAYQSLTIP